MTARMRIGRHDVGLGRPTYFVADIAANHDGSLRRAIKLIHLAAEAGAQAAKFQNFRASSIVSDVGFKSLGKQLSHQGTWKKSVYEVYNDAAIPLSWTPKLREACDAAGMDYFTAPYDLELLPYLKQFVCAWKVGSGDITWHRSIAEMAKSGKPLLLATGASNLSEVRAAISVVSGYQRRLVLMQCNTNYTGALDNFKYVNLKVLETYAREFPSAVLGLSDHTPGHSAVLGAVVLGARVIEKHFTDDKARSGPDHPFSMDPDEWREMVDRTRELELALGDGVKRVEANEVQTAIVQRRAIRARKMIAKGASIQERDLAVLRPCPAGGVPPWRIEEIIGRKAKREIKEGGIVRLRDLA